MMMIFRCTLSILLIATVAVVEVVCARPYWSGRSTGLATAFVAVHTECARSCRRPTQTAAACHRQKEQGGDPRFFSSRRNWWVTMHGASSSDDTDSTPSSTTTTTPPPYWTGLDSSYPPGTPALLRGEAIRSALRTSDRCLAWNLASSNNHQHIRGLVRLYGPGARALAQGKFSHAALHQPNDAQTGCWLTARGAAVDVCELAAVPPTPTTGTIGSAYDSTDSNSDGNDELDVYILTSPGHSATALMKRLDAYVFPMDQVSLQAWDTDCGNKANDDDATTTIFTMAALDRQHIQSSLDRYAWPLVGMDRVELPDPGQVQWCDLTTHSTTTNYDRTSSNSNTNDTPQDLARLLIFPTPGLSSTVVGYTLCWIHDTAQKGRTVWDHLITCPDGPIHVGALEYETLRMEAGTPAYGRELTGASQLPPQQQQHGSGRHTNPPGTTDTTSDAQTNPTVASPPAPKPATPAAPLELHLADAVDDTKGCYLGQEGVASMLKNPRGPPRLLYQVVFDDESNRYDPSDDDEYKDSSKDNKNKDNKDKDHNDTGHSNNLTRTPVDGDTLYVLGSNESILVGRLTSVAEPSGTGDPVTLALALVRRADSIQSSMRAMDLTLPIASTTTASNSSDTPSTATVSSSSSSGQIDPPPLDPLDGLEVIVGGTFTVGTLRMVPRRRALHRQSLVRADEIPQFVQDLAGSDNDADRRDLGQDGSLEYDDDNGDDDDDGSSSSSRKDGSSSGSSGSVGTQDTTEDTVAATQRNQPPRDEPRATAEQKAEMAAAEAKRKAEKMERLRQRAQEAMARRKKKKAGGD